MKYSKLIIFLNAVDRLFMMSEEYLLHEHYYIITMALGTSVLHIEL